MPNSRALARCQNSPTEDTQDLEREGNFADDDKDNIRRKHLFTRNEEEDLHRRSGTERNRGNFQEGFSLLRTLIGCRSDLESYVDDPLLNKHCMGVPHNTMQRK